MTPRPPGGAPTCLFSCGHAGADNDSVWGERSRGAGGHTETDTKE